MAGQWQALSLDSKSLPQLLVKATLDISGYTIHLTDLSRIWGETLTKKQLFRRALDDGCSIDPTEGDDQLRILLDKIGSAIEQRNETSINFHTAGEDDLVLTLTAPLPHPLPGLQWNVFLSPLPSHNVQAELVTPLLHHAQNLQTMTQNLVHELQDKDRVIAKITDRLEQSGQDLTDVFPGVSKIKLAPKRSHQTQREQLAKHVKGLGDFDERGWKARHASLDGHRAIQLGDLNNLLGDLLLASEPSLNVADDWWRLLNNDDALVSSVRRSKSHQTHNGHREEVLMDKGRDASVVEAETHVDGNFTIFDANDLDFQRQGTPPNVNSATTGRTQRVERSLANEQQRVVADDESTEDEDDDLDAPRVRTPAVYEKTTTAVPDQRRSISPVASIAMSRKLGTTGARNKKLASPDKESESSAGAMSHAPTALEPRSKLGDIEGKPKASKTSEPEPDLPVSASVPVHRSRLGRIGGKKQAFPSQEPAPSTPATAGSASARPPQRHGKIGRIGGKKAEEGSPARSAHAPPVEADEGNERKSRASGKDAKVPTPPRETSQERADRRREELKRQLEEKSQAPAKKKRKF